MIDVLNDKELLKQVITATTDAIMVIDRSWVTVYMNDPALEITSPLGYSPVGRDFWGCFPEAVYEGSPYVEHYYRAMNEGIAGEFEAYYPPPIDLWFNVQVRPTESGIILFTRNVTLQKRMTASMVTNEKLVALGRLSAVIAHEINNPLDNAQSVLYLASSSQDISEVTELIELVKIELDRINAIIRQTLRVNKSSLKPTLVSSTDMLEGLVLIFEQKAKRHSVELTANLSDPIQFLCFEGEIRQVLTNLIANGIEASSKGGKLAIRLGRTTLWHSGKPGIRITVSDDGSGISAEAKRKLFTPFFTTKGVDGTGLGLWISKDIVEKHGGRLLLKSSQHGPHRGTTFSVLLPLDSDLNEELTPI